MSPLFSHRGIHGIVDGQFGSTGKGALSAWLAEQCYRNCHFYGAIYSGGPNSGHTSWFEDEQIVLKQLPTFAVYLLRRDVVIPVYLSAGAVIDRDILKEEALRYPRLPIFVHPNATIVTDEDKEAEKTGSVAQVAGTRSGTGAAIARKVLRDPLAIAAKSLGNLAPNVVIQNHRVKPEQFAYFMEVSQGFSLGINSEFYPKVTSRECTITQGLSDARIAPRFLARCYMAIRTFPIRVGNVDGFSSGDWYEDQDETNWERIGVQPELTTVTKRVRRVATFSMQQFYEACYANDPDFVFVSHMDYLKLPDQIDLIESLCHARQKTEKGFDFIIGKGPRVSDISMHINGDDQ